VEEDFDEFEIREVDEVQERLADLLHRLDVALHLRDELDQPVRQPLRLLPLELTDFDGGARLLSVLLLQAREMTRGVVDQQQNVQQLALRNRRGAGGKRRVEGRGVKVGVYVDRFISC